MNVTRLLAGLGALVSLTGALTACGGGTSSGTTTEPAGAPTNASKADFCRTFESSNSDAKPSEVAARLEAVGTPDDIPDSARRGFEVLVDKMSRLTASDPSDSDLAKMAQGLKAGDLSDVRDFISYYVRECAGSLPSAGAS